MSAYFTALSQLSGSQGAKKIIDQNPSELEVIKCDAAAFDLDTPSDLALLATQATP